MISNLTDDELEVLRTISIHSILGVVNNGRKISLRCPFHQERTPSFFLYPDNKFYCFGCGKKGSNAIDFVVGLGYSFQEALIELSEYLNK